MFIVYCKGPITLIQEVNRILNGLALRLYQFLIGIVYRDILQH